LRRETDHPVPSRARQESASDAIAPLVNPTPLDARSDTAATRPSLASTQFVRVTLANFFFFLTFASFFLLPLHIRALGGSEQTVGFVMGMAGLSGLLSIFVVGVLLDRFGRRVFLIAGLALMALASAGFLIVDRVGPAMFLLRALQGVAFAAGFNAASTLAAELAPPDRLAAALGLFGISTLTTHAIAPTIGEQLVRVGGFDALFVVAAGFSVLGLLIAWSVPDPGRPAAHVSRRFHAPPRLAALVATVACCGIAFGAVITFVPTFAVEAQLGRVSTFFLSYTTTAVLTRLTVVGRLSDTLGRRAVIVPGLLLLALSILALSRVASTLEFGAVGLLFGLAQGTVYPTLNAFAVDHARPGQLGRIQSIYNGSFNIGTTLGSLALGTVVHAYGHRTMFVSAAGVAATALLVFALGTVNAPD